VLCYVLTLPNHPPDHRGFTGLIYVDPSVAVNKSASDAAGTETGAAVGGFSEASAAINSDGAGHRGRGGQRHNFPRCFLGIKADKIERVETEEDLFKSLWRLVCRDYDPDILAGYDIQRGSWKYLIERAKHRYNQSLAQLLSRIQSEFNAANEEEEDASNGGTKRSAAQKYNEKQATSELHISGRIFLNVWRIMREELTLTSYSFENVSFHLLKKRVPWFAQGTLDGWWRSGVTNRWAAPGARGDGRRETHSTRSCASAGGATSMDAQPSPTQSRAPERWRVLKHTMGRATGTHNMLRARNFVESRSEFARLFGILFVEVMSRGSQFRVESIMMRPVVTFVRFRHCMCTLLSV
jgi:DNA polymerase zeta